MNKKILCPRCQSGKLALSDAESEGANICNLLCLNCTYVFRFLNGIMEDDPGGNLKFLIRNLLLLNRDQKARYIIRRLTEPDTKAFNDFFTNLD